MALKSNEYAEDTAAGQVASELNDGIRNCRTILNDYRSRLSSASTADNGNGEEPAAEQPTR